MTHDELVSRAARWLRGTQRCTVVIAETASGTYEIPDAIGWRNATHSILVECKTSRADFFADIKHKSCHSSAGGMGYVRYFMTPPGLLREEEIPEGWGLLEVHPKIVRVKRKAQHRHWKAMRGAYSMERQQLFSALRILQKEVRDGEA